MHEVEHWNSLRRIHNMPPFLLSVVSYIGLLLSLMLLIDLSLAKADRGNRTGIKDRDVSKLRDLTVEVLNDTSVSLHWKNSQDSESNRCPVSSYNVRLKAEGVRGSRTWKIDGSRHSVTLNDLVTGSAYFVRMLAVDCGGKGKPSRWLRIRTTDGNNSTSRKGEREVDATVPGKPSYVRTRTFSDSVIVSWLPPENDTTVVRGYMIGYGEGVPDVNWQYLEASKTNATIRNLKPSTQYIVSLRAFNNAGKGPVVYELIYTRQHSATTVGGSSAPTHLKAKVLSPTTVLLQWSDPTLGRSKQPTDNRYYNVHYHPASPPSAGKTSSVVVRALNVVLDELLPGTKYEFKVRMVKNSWTSPFSAVVSNKTFEAAPSSSPRDSVVMTTIDSRSATWQPPRLSSGNVTGRHGNFDDVTGVVTKATSEASRPVETVSTGRSWNSRSVEDNRRRTKTGDDKMKKKEKKKDRQTEEETHGDRHSDIEKESVAVDEDQLDNTDSTASESVGNRSTESEEDRLQVPSDPRNHSSSMPPKISNRSEDVSGTPSSKSFRSVVHYQVSAYVTWPDALTNCGSGSYPPVTSSLAALTPDGYLFRYSEQRSAGDAERFVVRNLTKNLILLDDLVPDSEYRYQVKYLFGSTESSWSGESTFDTHYKRPGS